jgi:hypothetical protein
LEDDEHPFVCESCKMKDKEIQELKLQLQHSNFEKQQLEHKITEHIDITSDMEKSNESVPTSHVPTETYTNLKRKSQSESESQLVSEEKNEPISTSTKPVPNPQRSTKKNGKSRGKNRPKSRN